MLSPDLYKFFIRHLDDYPGNYLEIGTYDGEGISSLAKLYPEKMFFAVDPFISDISTKGHTGVEVGKVLEVQRELSKQNLSGLRNAKLFEEKSTDFALRMTQDFVDELNVDFVLLDGDHNYEDAINDFWIAKTLIRHEGLIYAHDLGVPGVRKAWDEFLCQYHVEYLHVEGACRFTK